MNKVSRPSSRRGVVRPARSQPVRRLKPRFGPEPVPQPVVGRLGLSRGPRRRRRPAERRAGQGAAAPLRFVFVRRLSAWVAKTPPRALRKPSKPVRVRPEPAGALSAGSKSRARVRLAASPRESTALSGRPPADSWPQPRVPALNLMVASLEPESVPEGLPEIPAILLEGDEWNGGPPPAEAGRPDSVASSAPGAVWLAGCDPKTLLMGWEDPGAMSHEPAFPPPLPVEWRLRPAAEPATTLASGTLPTDRRFLFLPDPPPAPAHVIEVGIRTSAGDWECLAASAPVSLPSLSGGPVASPTSPAPMRDSGLRLGVDPGHFLRLLQSGSGEAEQAGSSEGRLERAPDLSAWGASSAAIPSSGSLTSSRASDSIASPSGPPGFQTGSSPDEFWFRVNAEVVLFGSARPGAQVTIFGRPVELRPDGSFSFRCALPDGRFDVPMRAFHPQGGDVREATVTLARQTRLQGSVGAQPGTAGLPLPDAIP